jgi:hypothetical protein
VVGGRERNWTRIRSYGFCHQQNASVPKKEKYQKRKRANEKQTEKGKRKMVEKKEPGEGAEVFGDAAKLHQPRARQIARGFRERRETPSVYAISVRVAAGRQQFFYVH